MSSTPEERTGFRGRRDRRWREPSPLLHEWRVCPASNAMMRSGVAGWRVISMPKGESGLLSLLARVGLGRISVGAQAAALEQVHDLARRLACHAPDLDRV